MDLSVLGFSHKSASLEIREALAVLGTAQVYALLREKGFSEAAVLSTCNRYELYLGVGSGADPCRTVLSVLEARAGRSLDAAAYVHEGPRAVRHLFEVAAGLDSMVVGESEVLGQVKTAYEEARGLGMTGKAFNVLFQRALYVGKLVRTETGIAVGQLSTASVAVQLAESIFGALRESAVLILGAGSVAEACARHLLSRKVRSLSLSNRTMANAEELAARLTGPSSANPVRTVAWESAPRSLETVDIVIASTGSPQPVIARADVARAMRGREGRSLFLIDLAMPRDVEESVHGIDNVYLYRLGDLEAIVAENLSERTSQLELARRLTLEKSSEFSDWADSVADGRVVSLKHSPSIGR